MEQLEAGCSEWSGWLVQLHWGVWGKPHGAAQLGTGGQKTGHHNCPYQQHKMGGGLHCCEELRSNRCVIYGGED